MPITAQSSRSADPAGDALVANMLAATDLGIDVEEYLEARAAGATHHEVLTAFEAGALLVYYATARRAGATHAELLRYIALTGEHTYLLQKHIIEALTVGVTMRELLAAATAKLRVTDYTALRAGGISDKEATYVCNRRFGADSYLAIRKAVSARDALDALINGAKPAQYVSLRRVGVGHRKAIARSRDLP